MHSEQPRQGSGNNQHVKMLRLEASRSALHTGPALDRIRMLFADVLLIRYHLAGTIFSSRPICLLGFPDSVFFLTTDLLTMLCFLCNQRSSIVQMSSTDTYSLPDLLLHSPGPRDRIMASQMFFKMRCNKYSKCRSLCSIFSMFSH